jgi:uncharacterized membrane protein
MKKTNNFHIAILVILLLGALANMVLSMYVEQQKTINEYKSKHTTDPCFTDLSNGGGCATVQTSVYASTFGLPGNIKISNPAFGIFYFSILAIIFGLLLSENQTRKKSINSQSLRSVLLKILKVSLICGSIVSIWLLYVQYAILQTTCIYCLWVDAIMIISTILFLVVKPYLK